MPDCFIARHAILKDNLSLLGYDLLFRGSDTSPDTSPSAAFSIDASTMVFPWESLDGQALGFISFNIRELINGAALLLPRAGSIIDIRAMVPCNADVIIAWQELKNAGYRLSISGWGAQRDRRPLIVLADYLRTDLNMVDFAERSGIAQSFRGEHCILVAQNVATGEDHQAARRLGFIAFQGDFFLKPQSVSAQGNFRHAAECFAPAEVHPQESARSG